MKMSSGGGQCLSRVYNIFHVLLVAIYAHINAVGLKGEQNGKMSQLIQ